MVSRLEIPSYLRGYAKSRLKSAYQGLWYGLIGAWVPSLGNTGTEVRDVSGENNPGVLQGMTPVEAWVRGDNGLAIRFDGSDDTVKVDDPVLDQRVGTIVIKARRFEVPLQYASFINIENAANNSAHELIWWFSDGPPYSRFFPNYDQSVGDYWDFGTYSGTLVINEWHTLAVVWDNGSELLGYRDGKVFGSLAGDESWTAASWSSSEYLSIGGTGGTGIDYNCGCDIEFVYCWDRVLTAREIALVSAENGPLVVRRRTFGFIPEVAYRERLMMII